MRKKVLERQKNARQFYILMPHAARTSKNDAAHLHIKYKKMLVHKKNGKRKLYTEAEQKQAVGFSKLAEKNELWNTLLCIKERTLPTLKI